MEHLSNDHEDRPNRHEISHKLCVGKGHLLLRLNESQWKLRQQHDQNFPKEGNHCRANTRVRRRKQIENSRSMSVIVRDSSRNVNNLSKVVWDRKIITVQQVYQFHQNRLTSQHLKSPKTNTLTDGFLERISSTLEEIASKTVGKDDGDWCKKKK